MLGSNNKSLKYLIDRHPEDSEKRISPGSLCRRVKKFVVRKFDLSRNFSEFTDHLESIPFEKISTGALRHSLSLRV